MVNKRVEFKRFRSKSSRREIATLANRSRAITHNSRLVSYHSFQRTLPSVLDIQFKLSLDITLWNMTVIEAYSMGGKVLNCDARGHISKSPPLSVSIINHSVRNDCILCRGVIDIERDPTYDAMGSENHRAR